MRKQAMILLGLAFLLLLTGCGGGGGGGTPAPPAPQNFKADRKYIQEDGEWKQKTFLSWDAVTNATSYKVYRQGKSETQPTLLVIVPTTSYTDDVPNELWHSDITYYVSAVVNNVEGNKAQAKTVEPTLPPTPSPPQNLLAQREWVKKGNELVQITSLSWSAIADATSYKVYRQGEGEARPILLGSAQTTSYTDEVPEALWHSDITYYVSAVANNVEGNKAEAKTEEPVPPPPPL